MSEQQKKLLLSLEEQRKLTEELNKTLSEMKEQLEQIHNVLKEE